MCCGSCAAYPFGGMHVTGSTRFVHASIVRFGGFESSTSLPLELCAMQLMRLLVSTVLLDAVHAYNVGS